MTGKGPAGVVLGHYLRPVLYVTVSLLVIATTINLGDVLWRSAACGHGD